MVVDYVSKFGESEYIAKQLRKKCHKVSRPSKWTKVDKASHVPKKFNYNLIKCITACIVYLKWFGGKTSKNNQDVRNIVFPRISVL